MDFHIEKCSETGQCIHSDHYRAMFNGEGLWVMTALKWLKGKIKEHGGGLLGKKYLVMV
jgi:hypothetical protein